MLVNSNTYSYTSQTNTATSKKTNNDDYLHRAIKLEVSGEQNKLEFRDIQSGKLVEINVHEDIQRQLQTKFNVEFKNDKTVKVTGDLEKYLQTMWSKYQNDTNTKDTNNDGYLGIKELSTSKRNSWIGMDDNKKVTLASREKLSFEDMAKAQNENMSEMIKDYLSSNFVEDDKVSVDLDFNGFLLHDKNLDTNFSDKEHLLSMGFSEDEINPNKLLGLPSGFSAEQTMKKQMEEWIKQLKEKGLEELYGTRSIGETTLKNEELSSEKLIDVKKRVANIQNYLNTQADNTKIFSLKI
ncbi:MAG: hypothetical protein AABY36_03615 [Campylobacterota bacterium]